MTSVFTGNVQLALKLYTYDLGTDLIKHSIIWLLENRSTNWHIVVWLKLIHVNKRGPWPIIWKFLTCNLKACARDSHFILLFIFYHALLGFEIVRFSISLWEHVIGTVIYDSPSASEEILKDLNQCISWASCQIHKIASCACTGNAGNVSPPPRVSDPDMHHGTCVTHGPWCMPRSLTRGFLWSHWWGKRSRHSRRMRNPQNCVSGKRLMKTRREIM